MLRDRDIHLISPNTPAPQYQNIDKEEKIKNSRRQTGIEKLEA